MHRRQILAALSGVTVTGAAAGAARAFEVVPPSAQTLDLMREACAIGRRHAEVVAEIRTLLADQDLPEDLRARLVALDCPFCGCPVELDRALADPATGSNL